LLHHIEGDWEAARAASPSPLLVERLLHVTEAISDALQSGTLREQKTVDALSLLWKGKSSPFSSRLSFSSDIRLSSSMYQRLMGATESLLSAKMKVETLGSSLLGLLERSGKDDRLMSGEYRHSTQSLHRATVELETALKDARMTPLAVFFDRMPLLVKDISGALGKETTLSISGGELLADRLVIGELGGALGHLVKNAVDHGFDQKGNLRISAQQEHDHLLVSVEDDGKGIQYDALESAARTRGFVDGDHPLSPDARRELIFRPEVSMTGKATEISGRGMGMSAVREYVRSVGGNLFIESPVSPSGGTRVTLRIPTSLSLVRILLVRSGHATLGVPMTDLKETLVFREEAVFQEGGREMVRVGDLTIPFLPLSRILSLPDGYRQKGNPFLLKLDTPRGAVALLVDAILHEEEVLVKALPKILSSLSAFRGAAMMGDGRTVLIVDPGGMSLLSIPPPLPEKPLPEMLSREERDQLMEIMNMVASHAGGALARRFGSHIELSVPECADGTEVLPEEDWGATAIGVRMELEGSYPGRLLFEMPEPLSVRLTEKLRSHKADLHALLPEDRAFFQEIGQIAMHAVGNMLSKITKHPVMTKMSDARVDARGALRTHFLRAHQGSSDGIVRVRLWFGVGDGIRTDDHRETGSLTMEFSRDDARRLLGASLTLAS
jgi:chemotaxis protein CheY-P-specific phosphatase CheC